MLPAAASLFEHLPRGLRRHRLMTGWMALTKEDPIQLVRIRDDVRAYADMSDGFLRLIVIEPEFEKDFFLIADALMSDGGAYLDVGANHGLFAFGLYGRRPNVDFHLFEPNDKLVATLRKSLARFPQMSCQIIASAVADHDGSVSFLAVPDQTGVSHIVEDGEGETVNAVMLDTYLPRVGLDHVPLVKIDVEGFELSALRGAKESLQAKRIGAVYFEYCERWLMRNGGPAALLEFIDAMGYQACFCREWDFQNLAPPTHTLAHGLPGHGLDLRPISGLSMPQTTDLLAVPKEHLILRTSN